MLFRSGYDNWQSDEDFEEIKVELAEWQVDGTSFRGYHEYSFLEAEGEGPGLEICVVDDGGQLRIGYYYWSR